MRDQNIYATQMIQSAKLLKLLADDSEIWSERYRSMPEGNRLYSPYGHMAEVTRVQAAAFRQAVATIWENYQRAEDGLDW